MCMYVRMRLCQCACMCMRACVHVCVYVSVHVCVCAYVSVHVSVHALFLKRKKSYATLEEEEDCLVAKMLLWAAGGACTRRT